MSNVSSFKRERIESKDPSWWTAASVVALGVATASHGRLQATLSEFGVPPPSSSKPYRNLQEFYPFYLSEHKNQISRLLHVIGTSLVIVMLTTTSYRRHIPNFLIALSVGTMLCECFAPLSTGVIEFALLILLVASISLIRKQAIPWKLFVIGYLFAWVGHFWFEHNRPATFIYPTYSLMCDFVMWFQTVSFQLSLTKTLA